MYEISSSKGSGSGEVYKRTIETLDVPWKTVKAIVTGRPSKTDEEIRNIGEAAMRPTVTLKGLQEYLASTGLCIQGLCM